ncbi:MAG: hypothetical protein CMH50_05185 [Myxococcales bacterium]|nr:hypothetical protein [Myxococcales bacterium]
MRGLVGLLLLTGCATSATQLLPPLPSQWQRPGTEDQVVLERRLILTLLNEQGSVSWRRFERRFHRKGGEVYIQLPVHPDRMLIRAGFRMRTSAGTTTYRDLSDFVYTDRSGQPILDSKRAAFVALRITVEPKSLIDWAFEGADRRAHWLPHLALDGSYPIESGRLTIQGDPDQRVEVRLRGIQPKISLEDGYRHYFVKTLQPHLPHPWSPKPLGERALRPRFRTPISPDLVQRMTEKKPTIYDLQTSPSLQAGLKATPCVLLPWDLTEPSPMDVLLATAIPKAEGGLKATVDPVTARGFQSCRLVQAGAPADVSVRPQSGMALWRFQSIIGADGEHRTEGRLQVGGIAAFAVRQGQLDLKAYLQSRLGTRLGTIRLKQGGKDRGTGPVTISFGLRFKSQSLAPQDWLGKPYPELDWLRPQTRFLGPLINDERIDWEFQWASQSAPLPPTRSKTLTEPELVGSATWTLGSVRSVRFVQELRWQLKPHFARPMQLRKALEQLRLPPLRLEP